MLTIWSGYIRNGLFYYRTGRTYFGEQANIMRLAYGLTDNVYYEVLK